MSLQQPGQTVATQPVILDTSLIDYRIDRPQSIVRDAGMTHDECLGRDILDKTIHEGAERHFSREVIDAAESAVACYGMTMRHFPQAPT